MSKMAEKASMKINKVRYIVKMKKPCIGEAYFNVALSTDINLGLFSAVENKFQDYKTYAVKSILDILLLSSQIGNFDLKIAGFQTYQSHLDSTDIRVVVKTEDEMVTADKYNAASELCETLVKYFEDLMRNNFDSEVHIHLCKVDIDSMKFIFILQKSQSKWTLTEGQQVRKLLEQNCPNTSYSLSISVPFLEKSDKIRLNMKLVFYNKYAYDRMQRKKDIIQKELQICYGTDKKQLVAMKTQSIDIFEQEEVPINPMKRLEMPCKQCFLFGKKIERCIALVLVDIQNDFISGSLALRDAPAKQEGKEVIPVVNNILDKHKFDVVVYTQDWHPEDHCSFIDNVEKYKFHTSSKKTIENVKKYDQVVLEHDDGSVIVQDLWPKHCVQGSSGADFHQDLKVLDDGFILQKGQDSHVDSYSAFWDNARKSQSNLKSILNSKNITTVVIAGLAMDYCVGSTAIHAAEFGFETYVVRDGCRGIHLMEIEIRMNQMKYKGVKFIDAQNWIYPLQPKKNKKKTKDSSKDSPWLTPSPSHNEESLTEDNLDLTELLQNYLIFGQLERELNHQVDHNPGWFELGCVLSTVIDIKMSYLQRLRKRWKNGGGDPAEELFDRIKMKKPEFTVVELIAHLSDCGRNDIVSYLRNQELPDLFSELSLDHTEHLSSTLMEHTGANWDVLASKLNFSTSEIDHIRSMSVRTGFTYSPAGSLFRKIQQVCPKLKVKVFTDALRKIQRNDLLDFLLQNLKDVNDNLELNRRRLFTV